VVVPLVLRFLSQVYIQRKDVLKTFKDIFGRDTDLGIVSPTVLIYQEDKKVKRAICKQIVYSSFETRVWGLQVSCGNPACRDLPGNVIFLMRKASRDPNNKVAGCKCMACGWQSDYLERPAWLQELPSRHFFIHDYPLSSEQQKFFTSKMVPPNETK
jgi:hypothetical protein